ncbi:MAG: NAD(P)H-quinone oxidoreductase [Pseudomonadota bacterium]|nr:NAD(P)H-quinone oxidoreductase [Pseudomonadota bacterium]
MMHVVECRGAGSADLLHWSERPVPTPSAQEVLVRVAAAGLNRADILQRQGKYPPPSGASDILGMEVAGTVTALGPGVKRYAVGDRVCALMAGGGYAEYVVVAEGHCLPVPDGFSMNEAAALPEAIVTVWANVFEDGRLQSGETLLVHGGSSGIGTMAIQMAKVFGAKVIVTVGDARKAAACLELGAELAIDYKSHDFVEVLRGATSGRGVDVVLDMVGGAYVRRNLSSLGPHGRHVSIATQGGREAVIDIGEIMRKRLTLTGSTLRGRSSDEKTRLMHEVEAKVWPFLIAKNLKPLIYQVFDIKSAGDAHKVMESGQHIGKIVLEVAA